jgi:DNA-directed RNA polymerase specialized sigma subunit
MGDYSESDFVEVLFDKLIIESFPVESSPYHRDGPEKDLRLRLDKWRHKVKWHINHSLSNRQKEVIKLYLLGKKETEIGRILGIRQQVVNIYKHRAIKRLRKILTA